MGTIDLAPSSPPPPELRNYHPSRSVSPIPRPPSFPRRADKVHCITRNRLLNRSHGSDAVIKKENIELAASSPEKVMIRKSYSLDSLSSEDIIADLSATEQTRWRWASVVFHRTSSSCDEDDASTSTATSSSSISEETFSSSTPVLTGDGGVQGGDASPVAVTSPNADTAVTCPSTLSGDSLPDEPGDAEGTGRSVQFNIDATQFHLLEEHRDSLTQSDKEARWYSRTEIALQRRAMKQAIRTVRSDTRGADLLLDDSHLHPTQCVTGCERYYNMENRIMAQKMIVEAVLENKDQPPELLREICRNLSRPTRELATWHARLNAIQCWGLSRSKHSGRWTKKVVSTATPRYESPRQEGTVVLSTPLAPAPREPEASLDMSPDRVGCISNNLSLPFLSDLGHVVDSLVEEGTTFRLAPRIQPFESGHKTGFREK